MATQQMISPTSNDNGNNDNLIFCNCTNKSDNNHDNENCQMVTQQMTSPTNDNDGNLIIF